MRTAAIFSALYNRMTEAQAQIRCNEGHTTISTALASGINRERADTDQGQFDGTSSEVRLLAADEPDKGLTIGSVIEVSVHGGAWEEFRIIGRTLIGGVLRLGLGAEFE